MPSIAVSRCPIEGPRPFLYLWLAHVVGFDDSRCCLPCLVGSKSRVVRRRMPAGEHELEQVQAEHLYLCGSIGSYETNLHVPMRVREGAVTSAALADVEFTITGAEPLPLPSLPDDVAARYSRRQARCRNFQWGFSVFGGRGQLCFGEV